MRKILYISGTRADYGLMRHTLHCINDHAGLKLEVAVTGMHLMPKFGRTIDEIKKDKFAISVLDVIHRNDYKSSMLNFIGELILKFTECAEKIKPDVILVLGDRAEALAAATVGAYLMIPVAHIAGGDVSSTVDEVARHAITKLSNVHFASTKKSMERIIRMGEQSWRVHLVGAPGLDSILREELIPPGEISRKFSIDLNKPVLLVLQHPVTIQSEQAAVQMNETMKSVKKLGHQSIIIYPNADAGARAMIEVIEGYREVPFIKIYKNLPRKTYLSLLKIATVMIGNSSSGIIDAPSFGLPVVNIGSRQEDRERAENVIDVKVMNEDIVRGIKKVLSDENFRKKLKKSENPYGNGQTGERISRILKEIEIDEKLLRKRITYK